MERTNNGYATISDDEKVEAKFDKRVLRVTAAKKPEAGKAERKIEIKKE